MLPSRRHPLGRSRLLPLVLLQLAYWECILEHPGSSASRHWTSDQKQMDVDILSCEYQGKRLVMPMKAQIRLDPALIPALTTLIQYSWVQQAPVC